MRPAATASSGHTSAAQAGRRGRREADFRPTTVAIAQLAFIGDMVFITPLLDAVIEAWPGVAVNVIGRPLALELLRGDPRIARALAYDKEGADGGGDGLRRVAGELRGERRQTLFLGVSRSLRTALLSRLSGAAVRIGFAGGLNRCAYSQTVPRRDAERGLPQRPLGLLEPLGVPFRSRPLSLIVPPTAAQGAAARLKAAGWLGDPLLAIAPGANYATKRWPIERFRRLLELAEADGFQAAVYGGPSERGLIEALCHGAPRRLDRGRAGIEGLRDEVSLAALFVGNDSGPTHIARAVGTPALALHGPTAVGPLSDSRPYAALSLGMDCQPCSPHGDARCPLGHHRCLVDLSAEWVWQRARGMAREVSPRGRHLSGERRD